MAWEIVSIEQGHIVTRVVRRGDIHTWPMPPEAPSTANVSS